VQNLADFLRGRNPVARFHQRGLVLLADDVHAQLDAFVADIDGRAGNELAHLVLALAAERAIERVLGIAAADFAHSWSPSIHDSPAVAPSIPGGALKTRSKGAALCADSAAACTREALAKH